MSHKSTILIVDDEPIGRQLIDAILYKEGYNLEFAENGKEAFEKAKVVNPDLILMDVMMPEIDGFEVCQMLRADNDMVNVPIILVTALDDIDSRIRGLEAGADDYISKPFDRLELLARIKIITRLNRFRKSENPILDTGKDLKQSIQLNGLIKTVSEGISNQINNLDTGYDEIFTAKVFPNNGNSIISGKYAFNGNYHFYSCENSVAAEESIIGLYLSNIISNAIYHGLDLTENLSSAIQKLKPEELPESKDILPSCNILSFNPSNSLLSIVAINNDILVINEGSVEVIRGNNINLKDSGANKSVDKKDIKIAPGAKIISSGIFGHKNTSGGKLDFDNIINICKEHVGSSLRDIINSIIPELERNDKIEELYGTVTLTGITI